VANEDKSARYHRLHRRATVLGAVLTTLLFGALIVTPAAAGLRDVVLAATGSAFFTSVALYVCALALAHELLLAPLAYYQGVTLERRYGLSTQTAARWWTDHLKAGAIVLVFGVVSALIVNGLIGAMPERWWIVAAGVFALLLVVVAQLAPVLLLPLFHHVEPLTRADLVRRLVALAERARTPVVGVFEWRLSDRTRKANAALTGLGGTRRILVSDTLLAEHTDDEIEVVLAHELAHHVHGDIWWSIAVESVLMVVGFYVADRVLSTALAPLGLTGKDDLVALPLLALTVGAVSLVLRPLSHALSRMHERRADRFALTLTRNAPAFISAMKRLGQTNLAEERPSRLAQLMFYSHPPLEERIDAARAFEVGSGK
jgi:STE24 endopeptidase